LNSHRVSPIVNHPGSMNVCSRHKHPIGIDGPNAAARGDVSELLSRSGTFAVPKNAASVIFTVTAVRYEGSDDDGYADNVSL
jgi:hypothetical protein